MKKEIAGKQYLIRLLSHHRCMPALMALMAANVLGIALISQYIFGLEPCILCIIQRYPFGIVIGLGLLAMTIPETSRKFSSLTMGLIGLAFLTNSIIAFYHSGVEQKWWRSFLEGCAVPDLNGDIEQIMADIQARTEHIPCDAIPWSDPILHLSMANYNVILCLALGMIALLSAYAIWQKSQD